MRLGTYRRTSQIVFTVITLGGLLGLGTTGIIYPYFFCYSCPWDVGACPIGILEHSVIDMQLTSFMVGLSMLAFLIGFLSLMGIIFGRALCGWACPVGLLQDITKKAGISKWMNRKLGKGEIPHSAKYIKYLILIGIPIASAVTLTLFYTTFCPVGGITGTVPTLTFYSTDWLLGTTFPLKFVSIILFVILIFLVARGWCKYLCPVGAYLAPWNKASVVRVLRDEENCTHCGLCEKKCPMDVKNIGVKADMECILCGRCVESCNFKSLTLGSRFSKSTKGIAPVLIVVILVGALMVGGAAYSGGGYERVDAINAIPCLGCLALDPVSPEGYFIEDPDDAALGVPPHQDFVLENLSHSPVFLHYRTIVCAACDEMEPHIAELEETYGDQIKFIHINLDYFNETDPEFISYYNYDILGTPDDTAGVPLFSIVTYNETASGGTGEPVFKPIYGSSSDSGYSKKLDLEFWIQDAIASYRDVAGPIVIADSSKKPVVELFVDTACVRCPTSEEVLIELEEDGATDYVTYVTDAPGRSGQIATIKEAEYRLDYNLSSFHPWAIFSGGPEQLGAVANADIVMDQYLYNMSQAQMSAINVSIGGELGTVGGELRANMTLTNLEESGQTVFVEAFLVEKTSRWMNIEGDPIPNAVVDIITNQTYDVPSGGTLPVNESWTGTDVLNYSDFRLSNLGVVVTVWENGVLVNSRMIDAGLVDSLWLTADERTKAIMPNGTATFTFTVRNFEDQPIPLNLEANLPAGLNATFPVSNITVPANGSQTFTVDIDSLSNPLSETPIDFRVRVRGTSDQTIDFFQNVEVVVRNDVEKPKIFTTSFIPDAPSSTDTVTVTASVGDLGGIDNVTIEYYSCTDEVCDSVNSKEMTMVDANTYTADINASAPDHVVIHYKIIITDLENNVNQTDWLDVDITPVVIDDHDDGTHPGSNAFNTLGIPLILIFAMVAIGLNIARFKRKGGNKTPKDIVPAKVEPVVEETEVAEERLKPETTETTPEPEKPDYKPEPKPLPGTTKVPNNDEILARIEKAYREGRMSEEQYLKNKAKFEQK